MAAELFVALRQHVVGDQHGPQVSGDARAWVGVECLVGQFHSAGSHLGQQSRAGAVAQPVQGGAWGVGGGDRLIDRFQVGTLLAVGAGQRRRGSAVAVRRVRTCRVRRLCPRSRSRCRCG